MIARGGSLILLLIVRLCQFILQRNGAAYSQAVTAGSGVFTEIKRFCSAFGIRSGNAAAGLLFAAGWTLITAAFFQYEDHSFFKIGPEVFEGLRKTPAGDPCR